MKKINTNKDRLESIEKRGNLIKESFQKEFNKIKRLDETDWDNYMGSDKPKYVKKSPKGFEGLTKISKFVKSLSDVAKNYLINGAKREYELDDVIEMLASDGESSLENKEEVDEMLELIANNSDFFFKKLEQKFKGISKLLTWKGDVDESNREGSGFGKWGKYNGSPEEIALMDKVIKAGGDKTDAERKNRLAKQSEKLSKHIKNQYNKQETVGEGELWDKAGPDEENHDDIIQLKKEDGFMGDTYNLYIEGEKSDRTWKVYKGQETHSGDEIFNITNPHNGKPIKLLVYAAEPTDIQGRTEY